MGNSVVIFLVGLSALLVLYQFWFQNLRYVKMGNKIPGPPTIPILGNAYLALGKSPTGKESIIDILLCFYENGYSVF